MIAKGRTEMQTQSGELRLAMLGMVEGNGHPYSWSAIINGEYNREKMALCPYPTIPDYLGKQPPGTLGIPGARVTHVWTDDPADAVKVAEASCVGEVAARPEDVIGKVDAVIIATDKGYEHVDRARPFVEARTARLPRQPMTDNEPDLVTICRWVDGGARILSSSCMRYAKEIEPYHRRTFELGDIDGDDDNGQEMGNLRHSRAGSHLSDLRAGLPNRSATPEASTRTSFHIKHACGADIVVAVEKDMLGASGSLQLCGTAGYARAPLPGHVLFVQKAAGELYLGICEPDGDLSRSPKRWSLSNWSSPASAAATRAGAKCCWTKS